MAFRLPGGLSTSQQLWDFLNDKCDARGQVPKSRYNVSAFHDPQAKPGSVICDQGYFLDDDIACLDTSFFSMARMEVERVDPQQRLMLEVARECLEDAGVAKWKAKNIGCYMGSLFEDWCEIFARETQNWGRYRVTGYGDFVLSNRVSYEMDLRGPSMTIRTACSSSLVALDEACTSIKRGDCESAIVGGANLIMTPGSTTSLSEQNVLSMDGSCNTFSTEANGYARGEAITAIYVKKLDDALRDGNPIRAVIRGTATNHGGKTPGMTVPSAEAQEALIRRAYQEAGITGFSDTAFVECHGTGTPVGDPIEAKAVGRVFGAQGVYIGSVKRNLGHTEGASGLLSVIKTTLALENRIIPPNIKSEPLNPAIPFKSAKLTVPVDPIPWPSDRLERASVNSFGIGGTNAHVVLDSALSFNAPIPISNPTTPNPQLLLFSANSQRSLQKLVENYRQVVDTEPGCISDLAYTLANHREHLPFRTFGVAIRGNLGPVHIGGKSSPSPDVIMTFSGQGAQWPRMGRELLHSNATFLESIRRLDRYFDRAQACKSEWSIEKELRGPADRARTNSAEFSQPLCAAIQIALVDTFASVGIRPSAVVGHSSGEIAAAYAAGMLTAEEAIINAKYRGAVTSMHERPGAMAAVSLSASQITHYLTPQVTLACDNSPSSVTISGDPGAVDGVLKEIRGSQSNVMAKKLQVDKAYHSPHMAEIGGHYRSLIEACTNSRQPKVPFFSSVTGEMLSPGLMGPEYWQRNLESPVLFRAAITSLLHHPVGKNAVFLEIGPHSTLAGPLRQIMTQESASSSYVSSMLREQDCMESFLTAAGKLYTFRAPVDPHSLVATGSCLPDLPRYPWDHDEQYWYESRLSREYRQRRFPHHDLLGSRLPESTDFEVAWRNLFHLDSAPWIRDHKVGDDVIFPFAGYIAMAGEAARQLSGVDTAYRLRHIVVSTALVVTEGAPTETVTTLRRHRLTDTEDSSWWDFTIASHNGYTWTKHCTGQATTRSGYEGHSHASRIFPRRVKVRQWFDALRRAGLDLGPAFRNLENVSVDTMTKSSAADVLNQDDAECQGYHIHPTRMDSALQLLGIASANGQTRKFLNRLPVSCDSIQISRTSLNIAMNASTKVAGGSLIGELHGSSDGLAVLSVSGLKLSTVERSDPTHKANPHAAAHQVWRPDINFVKLERLIRPHAGRESYMPLMDDLEKLCLPFAQKKLKALVPYEPHVQRWHHWINEQVAARCNTMVQDCADESVINDIDHLVHRLQSTPAASAAIVLKRVCEDIGAICSAPPQHHIRFFGIENDPLEQGFEHHQYDLIISSNVLHTTTDVNACLANIKTLLHPSGSLLLQELCPTSKWVNFICGTHTDWWCGDSDNRYNEPYVEAALWQDRVTAAGYSGSETLILDAADPFQLNTVMLLKPSTALPPIKHVGLLCASGTAETSPLHKELLSQGFQVTPYTIEDRPAAGQDILVLLDQDGPFLQRLTPDMFKTFQTFLTLLDDSGILWVTKHSQMHSSDPRYAQIIGAARTIRSELLLDVATCEVDDFETSGSQVIEVLRKFQQRDSNHALQPDFEYAISDGVIHIGRFHPFPLTDQLVASQPGDRAVLEIEVPGRLNTLGWVGRTDIPLLQPDEVEVEMYAFSLNFRDVVVAMKIVDLPNPFLGSEGAGVIRRVGSEVRSLHVGDRVALIDRRVFSSTVVTLELLCVRLPDDLDFEEGSTMFFPYLTAMHSMMTVGGLEKGQSVLIHSACGGTGLAAVQLAQAVGADVYATVGSDEKVQHLMTGFDIPRDRIFNSRDDSFLCLLFSWSSTLPNRINRTLQAILKLYEQKRILPIRPVKVFDAPATRDAFRYMQRGQHIGRICISIRESPAKTSLETCVQNPQKAPVIHDTAAYLLVGGLGGLGRAVSLWMVEHGARHLVFLSRTADANLAFVEELNSLGCEVQLVRGSVTNPDDVIRAISQATKPIRGVLQMSMVLNDENLLKMSMEQWDAATLPKVQGTWNLHNATVSANLDLDFFVLFSSLSGILGQPGQANYAAANTFLDAFARYRTGMGLPASVIDIGAVGDIGYISGRPELMQQMIAAGFHSLQEQDVLDALTVAMAQSSNNDQSESPNQQHSTAIDPHHFILGLASKLPLQNPSNRALWKRDRRMAIYHNTSASTTADDETTASSTTLKSFVASARTDITILKDATSATFLAQEIGKRLFGFLMKPEEDVNTELSLSDLGMDSLVGIEMCAWWKQVFGFKISVLELLGMGNLEALGRHAAEGLEKYCRAQKGDV
ncbi:MAG: hypothetical protein Q9183_001983 [Haloplaca sp. 2 TL-2023]